MLCRGDSSKWNVLYFPIHEGLNSDKRRSPSIKTYTNIDLALRTVEIFDFSKNFGGRLRALTRSSDFNSR